tara:strand:+ start:1226 stop:1507 length:282 start_codon:yes stop_codon:yes gene_type:complete
MNKINKKKSQDLKITDGELSTIQNLVRTINQLQSQIGGLEIQKSLAIQRLHNFQRDVDTFQVELKKKYGDVSVNLQDGMLKEIPIENEVNKKN